MGRLLLICLFFALTAPALWAQEVAANRFGEMPLDAVDFSRDGQWLVTGGRDRLVRLWEVASGVNTLLLAGHEDWVTDVAFNSDSTRILSGGQDHTVRLWDTRSYSQLLTLRHHTRTVTGIAFSPDDRLIASGGLDALLWIGDAQTGAEVATLPSYGGPIWEIAFSPDSRTLVSGSENGDIWLWGLYDSSLSKLTGHTAPVTALHFSADGTQLASGSWDGTIRLWDLTSDSPPRILSEHTGPVMSVAFPDTPDTFTLASASLDGSIRLWDTRGGSIAQLGSSQSPVGAMALNHQYIAAVHITGGLELWPIEPRESPASAPLLPVFTPPPPRIQQLAAPTQIAEQQAVTGSGAPALSIPSANIYSPIITFYLDGTSWAIDAWERRVGHLQGTAWLDKPGNIALGGHSQMPDGRPGIFNGLYGVKIGDPIFLGDRRYIVSEIRTVHYRDLSVIYPTPTDRLTLITCDIPSFDSDTSLYQDRLVVIAVPG